ncbi:hypothetical protein GG496_001509 [Candidatus Fervidibacteria bacterium JGI MDM2 JNZ-1-D12]
MRNAAFWQQCAEEVGFDFDTPEEAVKFLTSVCDFDAAGEALDFFGEIFIEALHREVRLNGADPVFEYFVECEPYNQVFRLFIVGADRSSGTCLTLIPNEHRVSICIDVSQIRSLDALNDVFEKVLEHVRSVYQFFAGKNRS